MSAAPQTRRVNTFDVYVGNLPPEADQRKIGKIFSKFGEIHNIWLQSTSVGNKYGVVKFYCEEDSIKAIDETNGMIFEGGKPMQVKKYVKRSTMLNQKEEGEQEGVQDKDGKPAMPIMKPKNPDVVPSLESNSGPMNRRDSEKVLISAVETPIVMWGQKMNQENANELGSILDQLAIVCPEAPKVSGKPESDKIYGAKYSEDDCWYRCMVRYIFRDDRVKVQYIDFGNIEELDPSNMVELPKSLTALPPCALKFVLHSLWCNNNHDANAIKFLKELVEAKEVDAYTTARLSDGTGFFAEIYVDGICVNEKMLESNFAYKKPGLEQRSIKGRGQGPDGDAGGGNGGSSAANLHAIAAQSAIQPANPSSLPLLPAKPALVPQKPNIRDQQHSETFSQPLQSSNLKSQQQSKKANRPFQNSDFKRQLHSETSKIPSQVSTVKSQQHSEIASRPFHGSKGKSRQHSEIASRPFQGSMGKGQQHSEIASRPFQGSMGKSQQHSEIASRPCHYQSSMMKSQQNSEIASRPFQGSKVKSQQHSEITSRSFQDSIVKSQHNLEITSRSSQGCNIKSQLHSETSSELFQGSAKLDLSESCISKETNLVQHGYSMKGGMLNQRDGPRKFETEKDEIINLRWKLKNLQSEYSSLSNKAQENDISAQIKALQALSSMVRKLRNQFPLDKDTPLDEAIALVQQPDKIEISMAGSLPEVISAINAYKSAQDEIVKCSDSAILNEKIEVRNALRKDLHTKLNTTIEELNQIPLPDRGKKVQDVVSALKKHYDSFTMAPIPNLPAIDSLLPTFDEWKVKKKNEVTGARRMSDTMKSAVTAVLTQVDSMLSLGEEPNEEDTPDDMATTFRNFAKALQEEVATSDIENSPDAALIGSLAQALLRELTEEASCVDHLTNVHREFSSLKEQISPWLASSPTLEELQTVRSKLKSLKSKLRHKLADKMDAEENQETEELAEIAKDLEKIRGNIHKALKEEDKLMSELSQLASAHFPELLSSESDTGFSTHLSYKGLVKLSHAPDHYKLTSVGSSSSGMFVSDFDGEPVFIKEYFLSNGSHLDKDEFLANMALYTNASSSYLEPVSAVFFDKNNRHAYVQVKKNGDLLSTLIENATVNKQQCQSIVKSLCMALQALNRFNFVHGQIQPEFIVVDEEGNARLLPPDFSLTDGDRCRSKYTTSSGVEMIAPEMKPSKIPAEPAHSVDIYCLGLLTLWMHHPQVQFMERKEGTLDFSTVPLDHNLGIFLMKLMCPNPVLRPTAENCLRSEYLCQPVPTDAQPATGPSPIFGAGQDTGRNSASPASVLSQSSNDGIVYAESGAGVQMIANTRVPPPHLAGSSQPVVGSAPFAVSLPPSLQHPGPVLASPHQIQQLQMQQQFQQQQQQQQQQMQQYQQQQMMQQAASAYEPLPNAQARAEQNGSFEIGTFDPNAYEVVTSPQPATALRSKDGQDESAAGGSLPDSAGTSNDFGTASEEDALTGEGDFKDANDGAEGELDQEDEEDS